MVRPSHPTSQPSCNVLRQTTLTALSDGKGFPDDFWSTSPRRLWARPISPGPQMIASIKCLEYFERAVKLAVQADDRKRLQDAGLPAVSDLSAIGL